MEGTVSATQANGPGRGEEQGGRGDDLTVVRDQTHECLELLRSLVALMLSRQGERDGPMLEDLIAALVAQQREMLAGIGRIEHALQALTKHIEGGGSVRPNGYPRT